MARSGFDTHYNGPMKEQGPRTYNNKGPYVRKEGYHVTTTHVTTQSTESISDRIDSNRSYGYIYRHRDSPLSNDTLRFLRI